MRARQHRSADATYLSASLLLAAGESARFHCPRMYRGQHLA